MQLGGTETELCCKVGTNNRGVSSIHVSGSVPHLPTSRRPAYFGTSFHLGTCTIVFRMFCPRHATAIVSDITTVSSSTGLPYHIHLDVFVPRVNGPTVWSQVPPQSSCHV